MYFLSVSLQNPIYASQNEIMPFFTPSPCLSIQVASLLSTFLNLHGYNTSSQKVKLTHNNKAECWGQGMSIQDQIPSSSFQHPPPKGSECRAREHTLPLFLFIRVLFLKK